MSERMTDEEFEKLTPSNVVALDLVTARVYWDVYHEADRARLAEAAAVERAEKAEEQHYPVYIASLLMTFKREAEEQHARAARLAEAIEKAPHVTLCRSLYWNTHDMASRTPCDCWKSALSAQEKGKGES